MSQQFDATRLSLLLSDLRLPAVKELWATFTERADKEGWPAAARQTSRPVTLASVNQRRDHHHAATFSS